MPVSGMFRSAPAVFADIAVLGLGSDSLKKDDDGRTRVMLRAAGADDDDLIVSRRHVADVKRRLKKG